MKLKHLFGILVVFLLSLFVILFMLTAGNRGVLFYVSEGMVVALLLFLGYFYGKVVKPMDTIANGMDLLREQDFGSRLKPVGQQEADRVVLVFNKMMEQLKEERLRLQEQNYFLDLLIAVSPMGVVILNDRRQVTMANKAALRFLDVMQEDEIIGHTVQELPTPLAEEIAAIPKDTSRTIRVGDARIYRCSHLSFIDKGFAHPFILIESLTSEVVKAEKKAYEKVIRMIAHEVNNTVAGVTTTLDTVKDMLGELDESDDLQGVMTVCIERCLSMSHFITNFANVVKIPEPNLREVGLNDSVASCKIFMETLCREHNISLSLQLGDENPVVKMDRVLFEQVLVNILKNAVESIGVSGEIVIRTSAGDPMLVIADNGQGIPREVESKLFTPFFSTKPNGQGIGLLFIREVLDKHNCNFSLRTYADGWTRFCISFPKD